jgi:hypothetical protein
MNNLSVEAKELINDLFEEGATPRDIKDAMEDGAFLESARISQETAEEVHNLLSESFLLELHRNALDFCSDMLSEEQLKYCEEETK